MPSTSIMGTTNNYTPLSNYATIVGGTNNIATGNYTFIGGLSVSSMFKPFTCDKNSGIIKWEHVNSNENKNTAKRIVLCEKSINEQKISNINHYSNSAVGYSSLTTGSSNIAIGQTALVSGTLNHACGSYSVVVGRSTTYSSVS